MLGEPEREMKYVAFLRAINVGGHVVKMETLKRIFESLDLEKVETFIASGNVIFDSPRKARELELRIQEGLQNKLGYSVTTFLRTIGEVSEISNHKPFPGIETGHYVAFLPKAPPAPLHQKLLSFGNETDRFAIHKRGVYWLCRTSFSESTFSGALLEKTLALPATIRNVTTVKRIAAKFL